MCGVVLFKHKTAYEMRISDWSSDVCSSDLYEIVDSATVVIRKAVPSKPSENPQSRVNRADNDASATQDNVEALDTVTVTGTRIRGGITPSPVITIDSRRIREEGLNDLGEVIQIGRAHV